VIDKILCAAEEENLAGAMAFYNLDPQKYLPTQSVKPTSPKYGTILAAVAQLHFYLSKRL
jgi:hypothetical protein